MQYRAEYNTIPRMLLHYSREQGRVQYNTTNIIALQHSTRQITVQYQEYYCLTAQYRADLQRHNYRPLPPPWARRFISSARSCTVLYSIVQCTPLINCPGYIVRHSVYITIHMDVEITTIVIAHVDMWASQWRCTRRVIHSPLHFSGPLLHYSGIYQCLKYTALFPSITLQVLCYNAHCRSSAGP